MGSNREKPNIAIPIFEKRAQNRAQKNIFYFGTPMIFSSTISSTEAQFYELFCWELQSEC
jgi:hypothetical protein